MHRALALLFLVELVATAPAQEPTGQWNRFQLFNTCRPVRLVVETVNADAHAIGLTKAILQDCAESRLRTARLYTESEQVAQGAYLYVNVNVATPAFSISTLYYKAVIDAFGAGGPAATWALAGAGTHKGDADYVVTALSWHVDRFLAEYRHVNGESCGTDPARL